MANCMNHPGAEATATCQGCLKAFCADCVVDLRGQVFCGKCKNRQVRTTTQSGNFTLPSEALKYAIIGIFCFGIILEPIAIIKASQALSQIGRDPSLPGKGTAIAALVVGIAMLVLWIIGIIVRVTMAGQT